MKRVGLLGMVLVLALGPVAVAQSPSANPVTNEVYAPEDMAILLPSEVAGMPVKKFNVPPDVAAANLAEQFGSDEVLRSVLSLVGKDAADLRLAFGYALGEDEGVVMYAIRVEGAAGEDVTDGFLWAFSGAAEPTASAPPEATATVEDIAGRQVLIWRNSLEPTFAGAFYPVGDVLFVILANMEDVDGTVDEIVTALP